MKTLRLARAIHKIQISNISSSVDKAEIERFSHLASHWGDEDGPFKALHSLNKLRVPWILKNQLRKESSVLDVGCGGGILSVPLARCGHHVTGIDAAPDGIAVAKKSLELPSLKYSGISNRVQYHSCTAEEFAVSNRNSFDAVIASEILEHVADIDSFVGACAEMTKVGGSLFFTTINRTFASKAAAIWLAEDILKIVPKGVHEWQKFVTPDELSVCLNRNGCRVKSIGGFTYDIIGNQWIWTSSSIVNYALVAEKIG